MKEVSVFWHGLELNQFLSYNLPQNCRNLKLYLERDSNTRIFLLIFQNFENTYFAEYLRMAASKVFYGCILSRQKGLRDPGPGVDPRLILWCCKILQNKSVTIRCVIYYQLYT